MEPTDAFLNIPLFVMQAGTDWLVDKMVVKWFNELASHNKTYREWEGLYHEILMSLNGKTFLKRPERLRNSI